MWNGKWYTGDLKTKKLWIKYRVQKMWGICRIWWAKVKIKRKTKRRKEAQKHMKKNNEGTLMMMMVTTILVCMRACVFVLLLNHNSTFKWVKLKIDYGKRNNLISDDFAMQCNAMRGKQHKSKTEILRKMCETVCVCVICADDNNGIRSAGSNFHRIFSGPIHFAIICRCCFVFTASIACYLWCCSPSSPWLWFSNLQQLKCNALKDCTVHTLEHYWPPFESQLKSDRN